MSAGAVRAAVGGPPGWYGKVSMLGDFAHRRLEAGFVRRVDRWLSAWIADSQAVLGAERWRAAYLEAPLLRFAWRPGIAGPDWWFGVLMPSCDRAGRYFPLLVAAPGIAASDGRCGGARRHAWFDHVAAAATGTLDDGATVEAFEAALAVAASLRVGERVGTSADDSRSGVGGADTPARPGAGSAGSHWWIERGDAAGGENARVTTLHGLPDALGLTRLLFGAAVADEASG